MSSGVTLSYEKSWAEATCAVLEREGIQWRIALRDIIQGGEWGASSIKGINGSRMMVLMLSGHANASGQVLREVERAISRGAPRPRLDASGHAASAPLAKSRRARDHGEEPGGPPREGAVPPAGANSRAPFSRPSDPLPGPPHRSSGRPITPSRPRQPAATNRIVARALKRERTGPFLSSLITYRRDDVSARGARRADRSRRSSHRAGVRCQCGRPQRLWSRRSSRFPCSRMN
jgi:hypothetical protein